MDTVSSNLTHHFLIAMPHMADPHFARTLTYIAEHNDQGALGLIVNRPIDMTLGTLFERVELRLDVAGFNAQPVYFGGPVQTDRGFVLHRPTGDWHSTLKVNDEIGLTSSRDILQAIGSRGEPREVLVSLGFAAWTAGQLEQELVDNAWLTVPADMSIIFDLPSEERLTAALHKLGIDLTQLSVVAGHA
ncbi:MAG: YqgE/AlgH family protein [Azoarcus sp.]|jgi:putative transcriptional regulator|nr:YqgE/AlgH family protein [Azoarcus sp.]